MLLPWFILQMCIRKITSILFFMQTFMTALILNGIEKLWSVLHWSNKNSKYNSLRWFVVWGDLSCRNILQKACLSQYEHKQSSWLNNKTHTDFLCNKTEIDFYPIGRPGAPASISVKSIGETEIEIEWKPPRHDGGSRVRKYHIFTMTDEFQDSWVEVATVDSFRTSHLVTRLKHDKKYYFAVSAENEKGSGDKAGDWETHSS